MSISYSAITNSGRVTLPSVDSWGTNLNILKDPPKSIHTRKIDKVGDNNTILEQTEDSNDRICEAINVYARGVNPSVSVSYSNNGNNGTTLSNIGSSKMPYGLKDFQLRPEKFISQQELLPLSRMSRSNTQAFTNANFTDFSKKLYRQGQAKEIREVYDEILNYEITPKASYVVGRSGNNSEVIHNKIQNCMTISTNTGTRTLDITQLDNKVSTQQANLNLLNANAVTNLASNNKYVNNTSLDTSKFLQDTLKGQIVLNKGDNIVVLDTQSSTDTKYLPVKDSVLFTNATTNKYNKNGDTSTRKLNTDIIGQSIKNINQYSLNTGKIGSDQSNHLNTDIKLGENLKASAMHLNKNDKNKQVYLQHENHIDLKLNKPRCGVNTKTSQGNHNQIHIQPSTVTLKDTISPLNPDTYFVGTKVSSNYR